MNRRKETYKLGRKLINSMRVPMTRKAGINADGTVNHVTLRFKHDMIYNKPVGDRVHGFHNEVVRVKAGQVRLRRPKTEAEAKKYYGHAIRTAIYSTIAQLHSKYDKPSNTDSRINEDASDEEQRDPKSGRLF